MVCMLRPFVSQLDVKIEDFSTCGV